MESRREPLWIWLLVLAPFVGYLANAAWHIVNVPFWDDYPALLEPINGIIGAPATVSWLSRQHDAPLVVLFTPHGPHPFVIQRLVMLLQAWLGDVDFRTFIWLANLGWALTAATLVVYLRRARTVPLWWLAPIPYLLLSTSHWESVDFATESFQYYWGGGLFAVLAIILAEAGQGAAAGVFCGLSMLSFGGAPALLLVVAAMLVGKRQWKPAAAFLVVVLVLIAPYLYYFGTPSSARLDGANVTFAGRVGAMLGNPIGTTRYVLVFLGNYFTTGEYSLERFTRLFLISGSAVSLAAAGLAWKARRDIHLVSVPAALWVYVFGLASMAAMVRSGFAIAPRYSIQALLGAAAVYAGYAILATRSRPSAWATRLAGTFVVASVVYWSVTLYVTQPLFRENRYQRTTSLARYVGGELDGLRLLSSDANLADRILRRARELGVYDFSRVNLASIAPPEDRHTPADAHPNDPMPWSSLTDWQRLVLSVGEPVWSDIPVEVRRNMLAMADRWTQTEAADQWKMLNELRDYAGLPHVGPDADK